VGIVSVTTLKKLARLTCSALVFLPCPGFGEANDFADLTIEELTGIQVSSASKYVQPVREAPASVEVISRHDIQRNGWRTLTDALSSLPGIYNSTDHAYSFLGTRGFSVPGDYNTRFLLLIDGVRASDATYGQASLGQDFGIDMALIERIEYVSGPGSAIYGGNAIFGVVNVITRKAEEHAPLSISAFMSSDGWREGRMAGVQRYDSGATMMLSYSRATKSGRDIQYADPGGQLTVAGGGISPDGVAHDADSQQFRRLYGRYENGGFSVTGRYSNRQARPASGLYGTLFNDTGLVLEDVGMVLNGRYQGRLADDARFEARVDYSDISYQANYPYEDSDRYLNRDKTSGRSLLGDFRYFYNGFDKHKVLAGFEAQWLSARQRNYDLDAAINPPIDVTSRSHRLGLYIQDEWAFASDWRLSLGVRYDAPSDGDGQTSPRLGLIWLPSPATSIKLLAGSAYRLPTPYERDYANGFNYLANPGLKPEEIRTLELVWEQQLGNGKQFKISAFDYSLKQLITQRTLPGDVYQYANSDSVGARGVETSWHSTWASGARLQASITYTHTFDGQGNRLGNAPNWQGKLLGMAPVWKDVWWLAADAQAASKNSYQWNGQTWHLPAGALINATLSGRRIWAGMDVHIRARNLLGRHFAYPASGEGASPSVPGYGRAWEMGVSYAF